MLASPPQRFHQRAVGGAVIPIATPVTKGGGVDFGGLGKLALWAVSEGVEGIFVAGTTGRFSHFSPEDNGEICRAVVDAVGGAVTIYGGICDSGLRRMLANAERMRKAGADYVVTTGPFYLSRLAEEAEADLLAVADRSPLPVIYYNLPEFVGYGLRAEWIAEAARHANVAGYKDSSDDSEHFNEVLARTRGEDFAVLIGKERLVESALRCGAEGLVVSLLMVEPDPFVSLVKHARVGDWEAAAQEQRRVQQIIADFKKVFEQRPVFSTLMQYLESKLRERGIAVRLL